MTYPGLIAPASLKPQLDESGAQADELYPGLIAPASLKLRGLGGLGLGGLGLSGAYSPGLIEAIKAGGCL